MEDAGYKGFRDRAAHDRAHQLFALPSWHPDAPAPPMRHMLRAALRRCLSVPGYCDYDPAQHSAGRPPG
jgi:hypothetical protein